MSWLTIKEVSDHLDIPDPTLRRYLSEHGQFIKMSNEGHVQVIAEESLEVLKRIRSYYAKRWPKSRIQKALAEEFPLNVVIGKTDEGQLMTAGETLDEIMKMRQFIIELLEENRNLRNELKELRILFEHSMDKDREDFKQLQNEIVHLHDVLGSRKDRHEKNRSVLKRILDAIKDKQ